MKAVLEKELWSYLGNWSAWIIIAVFSLVSGLFLFFFENNFNFFDIGSASMQSYFVLVPWLLIFIIPALSMKSLAEEQQSGTLSWLFSESLKIHEIIVGKFLSVWIIGILCILPSWVYFYTLSALSIPEGNLDLGMILGGYGGLLVLIATFSAVGILSSSLSSHQVIAYLVGVFLCFFLYFGMEQLASYKLLGGADYIFQRLGFYYHYNTFTRGLVDISDIFYFVLIVFLSLRLAIYFVERKK